MDSVISAPHFPVVSEAYARSTLFDKMKKEGSPTGAKPAVAEKPVPEKPAARPKSREPIKNTLPFAAGETLEYGPKGEAVRIAISERGQVKITFDKPEEADDRRKTVRALVLLGLGQMPLETFNQPWQEKDGAREKISRELDQMGIDKSGPFVLGRGLFYTDDQTGFRTYAPVDLTV